MLALRCCAAVNYGRRRAGVERAVCVGVKKVLCVQSVL